MNLLVKYPSTAAVIDDFDHVFPLVTCPCNDCLCPTETTTTTITTTSVTETTATTTEPEVKFFSYP